MAPPTSQDEALRHGTNGRAAPSNASPRTAIQDISQRLQEGWKMMADSCPICTTPLLASREGQIYCVTCKMFCVTEGELELTDHGTSQVPTEMAIAARESQAALQQQPSRRHGALGARPERADDDGFIEVVNGGSSGELEEVAVSPGSSPAEESFGRYREERDRMSSLMGRRLLEGWTMLQDTCPVCSRYPLMSLRGGPHQCVMCGEMETTEMMTPEPSSHSQMNGTIAAEGGESEEGLLSQGSRQGDSTLDDDMESYFRQQELQRQAPQQQTDCSAFIGEKLLLGWTLLAETCPACDMPLLRDRSMQCHCPSCHQKVTPQEDVVATGQSHTGTNDTRQTLVPVVPKRKLQERDGPEGWLDSLGGTGCGSGGMNKAEAATTTAAIASSLSRGVTGQGQESMEDDSLDLGGGSVVVVDVALSSIYKKIRDLSGVLERSTGLDVDEKVAVALAKLGEAALSMEVLRGKLQRGPN